MTEWVYLVNDRHAAWGYPFSPVELFAGKHRSDAFHIWTLPRLLRDFQAGDFIWVRATAPLSAFIGVGEVVSDLAPADDDVGYVFDVVWHDQFCAEMAANPIPGVLEKHTQSTRRFTPSELRQLHRKVGTPSSSPPAPPGKTRRMQEVVARQGQPDFRLRLIEAYVGQCAVTGCIVLDVLQAAHIAPYDGLPTNTVTNGLLLRADVHNLFDRGLLWVTDALRIGLDRRLDGSDYEAFRGNKLKLPVLKHEHPDCVKLRQHRISIALQAR